MFQVIIVVAKVAAIISIGLAYRIGKLRIRRMIKARKVIRRRLLGYYSVDF